ncbi:6393_t:CDS:1, partial [Gigaspora margarita]
MTEIHITASQIFFYNAQGEPAYLTFSSDLTMNTFTWAMNLYMEDIKQTKISIRFFEKVVGKT